jgi:hypothetical protein
MPRKKHASSNQVTNPSAKKSALGGIAAAAVENAEAAEDSDDLSDPEDDIIQEEMERMELESSLLDFSSARDAGRERVAPRTRYQYDLFIGLMAQYLKDDGEFAGLVIVKQDTRFESVSCPIPLQAIKKYLDYVAAKQVPVREPDCESLIASHQRTKHVSVSYFNSVIQSLRDLYKCEQIMMTDETNLFIESRRKIHSRKIADLKTAGIYPTPPTRFISDDGYSHLCKTVCSATPTEGGWADTLLASMWAYIVLLWNLMTRCDRTAQLLWTNISWYKDCMTVFVPKSKSDQTGERAFAKKLYCANDPSVCPVLSCAVLFFTRTDYRSDFVFPRADTRRSGLRQLGQLIAARYSAANFSLFACNPLHIAWHHFKRGAFTFLGAMTDGPSWVGCKLRGDQTVCDSSKPYLYQGSGQDGLIGRLLALLPYGDPDFILGPPALPSNVAVSWDVIIPDWERLPVHLKHGVVPRFFAVIAFHYDWLRENLHSSHPLFHCTLFTTHLQLLIAAKGVVFREQLDMRHATGVSLSVRTAIHVQKMQSQEQTSNTAPRRQEQAVPPTSGPLHAPSEMRCLQPAHRASDLSFRMVQVGQALPSTFRIPHLSCSAAWRAWWMLTDSLPLPLRFCAKRLPKGANHAAEATRFSRIKKVMSFISTKIPEREILANPKLAFDVGWKNLAAFMDTLNVTVDANDACSTVEEKVRRVAADIPQVLSLRPTPPLPQAALPLHQAAAAVLSVFDTPNLSNDYATAASSVDKHRGTNPKWPPPDGPKFDGAVQCLPCPFPNCTSWQKSESMMTQHMDRVHDDQQRAQHMHFYQNEWCFRVSKTSWCFPTGAVVAVQHRRCVVSVTLWTGPNRTYQVATQETYATVCARISHTADTSSEIMRYSAAPAPVPTNSRSRKAAKKLAASAEPVSVFVQQQREAALAAYTAALLSK